MLLTSEYYVQKSIKMALEVNKCCFCVELKTGSLIIGYLGLVWNIILTLMVILGIVAAGAITSQARDDNDAKTIGTAMLVVMAIVAVFVVLNLIFSIVLLVGLHQNKRGHVKAYLIYTGIFIVLGIIFFITSIAQGSAAGEIIKYLINLALSVYFLIVIRSYWLKMDDASMRPAIYNTA